MAWEFRSALPSQTASQSKEQAKGMHSMRTPCPARKGVHYQASTQQLHAAGTGIHAHALYAYTGSGRKMPASPLPARSSSGSRPVRSIIVEPSATCARQLIHWRSRQGACCLHGMGAKGARDQQISAAGEPARCQKRAALQAGFACQEHSLGRI